MNKRVTRFQLLLAALLMAVTAVVSSASSVLALNNQYDSDFYNNNNIEFYDPRTTGCGAGSGAATQLTGSTNEEKIYNFWLSQGLTPTQSAGITGSMQNESGFSAFRQEDGQTWPAGGYGVAQFSFGQRSAVTTDDPTYNLASLGDTYTKYYVPDYGGAVGATGIPSGVPVEVNDQFLQIELNYLASFAASYIPNSIRTGGLQADFSIPYPSGTKLLAFLQTLGSASDAAEAWTYLYEQPDKIKITATARAASAAVILSQYGGQGSSASCGQINCPASGLNLGLPLIGLTAGDGSATAIVNTATCLSFPATPTPNQGSKICGNATGSGPNLCKAPAQPASYAAALPVFAPDVNVIPWAAGCAPFVTTVMRMSGADPGFAKGTNASYVPSLIAYMKSSSLWEKAGVTNGGTDGGIQPGDIVTGSFDGSGYDGNGHVYVYLGDGKVAQASGGFQWPQQENAWMKGTIWRLKSND